jgi:hypothetical protein
MKIYSFQNQMKAAPRKVNALPNHIDTLAKMVGSVEKTEIEDKDGICVTSKSWGDVKKSIAESLTGAAMTSTSISTAK